MDAGLKIIYAHKKFHSKDVLCKFVPAKHFGKTYYNQWFLWGHWRKQDEKIKKVYEFIELERWNIISEDEAKIWMLK
jgi:hypothetical protein